MEQNKAKHPKELFILAFAELCERYTFWGVGNLLVLYMVGTYNASAATASHLYGIFAGCAAFLPLIGGYVADRWNYHHPLFLGASVNVIGCLLLATGHPGLLHLALAIIALGYGIFTPSILTLLSFTYKDKAQLREAGFSIYYAAVNVGVFLAMISLGYVAHAWGWRQAFLLAAFVQLIGFIPLIWYMKKHHVFYKDLHPRKLKKESSATHEISKQQKDRIIVIFALTLFSIVFWMPYSQGASSMSIFSLNFTNRFVGSFQLPAAWILSSESLFLILLAPVLAGLYKYLQKVGRDPSASLKTAFSLFSMAICFAIMMVASKNIPLGAKSASVSYAYPIIAYFFMAVGEMLLAPIGLSLVTQLSPKRYTALLVGLWYVCVGLSFYIGGLFAGLIEKIPSLYEFFSIFVFVAAIPGIILVLLAKKLSRMSHRESL
jgi:proton-dependent oligopeptide transporter, POT family